MVTSSGAEVLCPYLHVMIVEMIEPVSFVICSVLYQNDPLKHHLKLQAALTQSALRSGQFSIIQSRNVSQLKSKM